MDGIVSTNILQGQPVQGSKDVSVSLPLANLESNDTFTRSHKSSTHKNEHGLPTPPSSEYDSDSEFSKKHTEKNSTVLSDDKLASEQLLSELHQSQKQLETTFSRKRSREEDIQDDIPREGRSERPVKRPRVRSQSPDRRMPWTVYRQGLKDANVKPPTLVKTDDTLERFQEHLSLDSWKEAFEITNLEDALDRQDFATGAYQLSKERIPLVQKTCDSEEYRHAASAKPANNRLFDPKMVEKACADNPLHLLMLSSLSQDENFLDNLSKNQKQQALLLSHTGVGPGKAYQIMSSNPDLPEEWQQLFSEIRSNCAPTYTQDEAQALTNQLYGEKYHLKKRLGVATISEVYLAQDQHTQKNVIVKVLKKDVTQANLHAEQKVARNLLKKMYPEPELQAYKLNLLDNFYLNLHHELDFKAEAMHAESLQKGATQYSVAQILDKEALMQAENPKVMIQEMAKGVSLDELLKMLKTYKASPESYQTLESYQDKFKEHPWLKSPNVWMDQLPHVYRDGVNEQMLQSSIIHPDPQPGNAFIHCEDNKLKMQFIDCGGAIERDSNKKLEHAFLSMALMTGDSHSVASYMVNNAEKNPGVKLVSTLNKRETAKLIKDISQELDEKLYKKRISIKDGDYNSAVMSEVMEKYHLLMPDNETAFMKTNMQARKVYKEISHTVGQPRNSWTSDSAKDMMNGLGALAWESPIGFTSKFSSVASHFVWDYKTAIRNTSQFLAKRV